MIKKSTIGNVLLDAGIITINKDRCVCNCCKATGRAETLNIKHKPDCNAYATVRSFIDQLHDDDHILPRVENPIELDVMLPYLAEITKEEYTVADAVATALFAAATPSERDKLWERVEKFEPVCNRFPDIKDAVVKQGLESNTDRVTFRSWLIYRKVHERKLALLEAEHYQLECAGTDMDAMFAEAFDL